MYPAKMIPRDRQSELEAYIKSVEAHIICVHFVGDVINVNNQKKMINTVVRSSERFEITGTDEAPMAFIYQSKHNHVTCVASRTTDTLTYCVWDIRRWINDEWVAPYSVGVVQSLSAGSGGAGANDFKEAMTFFHTERVSFVSVHGVTTAMGVHGVKAHLLVCNPMWQWTNADTAVADNVNCFPNYEASSDMDPGPWQWCVIPHYILSLVECYGKVKLHPLNKTKDVDIAMHELAGKSYVANALPETLASGPAVTFPPGVREVDLDDEDADDAAPPQRQLLRYVHNVFQPPPHFFKALHSIRVCFGRLESHSKSSR